ncbi:MAG: outer membrane lipoprotein carrier protein LolA [Siphonobacter sp.]
MKSRIIVFITSLLITTLTSIAQDKRAATILDAMSKKYKSMQSFGASFVYGAAGESYKGDILTKNGKYQLKLAGQEIYNDGKTIATYVKENNEVSLSNYDPSEGDFNPANVYTIYKKGYKYSFVQEKGGNEIVDLVPESKSSKVAKVQITVGKTDHSIKSWVITEKSGKTQSFRITKFTPNVSLTDAAFTFDKNKHPGVEVIDLRD